MTTCRFAFDDGAYVLGALSPAERAEFERHLPGCAACRKSVASLAVLPGLLSRLDATTVFSQPPPPTLLPRTLRAIATRRRAESRRRWWYAVAAAFAAIALAALAGVGARLTAPTNAPPVDTVALTAMRPIDERLPVTAEIGIVEVEGGTRIDMRCRYEEGYEGTWTVRMVVFPIGSDTGEPLGSWTASSGQEISLSALTHLSPSDIGRIELQRGDNTALLEWSRT